MTCSKKEIEGKIENLLKKNKVWVDEEMIAKEISCPFLDTASVLRDLEQRGLIDGRYSK